MQLAKWQICELWFLVLVLCDRSGQIGFAWPSLLIMWEPSFAVVAIRRIDTYFPLLLSKLCPNSDRHRCLWVALCTLSVCWISMQWCLQFQLAELAVASSELQRQTDEGSSVLRRWSHCIHLLVRSASAQRQVGNATMLVCYSPEQFPLVLWSGTSLILEDLRATL